MKVKEIMKAPVYTASVDMPTSDVAQLLVQHRISAVPVIDAAGAVVGLVSEHDLISKDGPTAADVMSPGIVSVTEDAEVDDVRPVVHRAHRGVERLLLAVPRSGVEGVGRPVHDRHDDRVVGTELAAPEPEDRAGGRDGALDVD